MDEEKHYHGNCSLKHTQTIEVQRSGNEVITLERDKVDDDLDHVIGVIYLSRNPKPSLLLHSPRNPIEILRYNTVVYTEQGQFDLQ